MNENIKINICPPEEQGKGEFDGGKITEIKPIGFPGEGSGVVRVGPLFYWAWATAHEASKIALHPHQAFEIISYVIEGEIGHFDTGGHNSKVGSGGLQGMQTGSGISHEESFGNKTDFFQIWFEPYLRESIKKDPKYFEFKDDDFPYTENDGVTLKTVIGKDSPVKLNCEAKMLDIVLSDGNEYKYELSSGYSLAVVTISGSGKWMNDDNYKIKAKDFTVISSKEDAEISVKADEGKTLRLVIVEVPSDVDYPLYQK